MVKTIWLNHVSGDICKVDVANSRLLVPAKYRIYSLGKFCAAGFINTTPVHLQFQNMHRVSKRTYVSTQAHSRQSLEA
jgi:hypothetical protein